MKFYKSSVFFIFAFCILVISCNPHLEKKNNISPLDENSVSLIEAKHGAKKVNSTFVKNLKNSYSKIDKSNLSTDKEVEDVIAVPDEIKPSYYIINYKNGGFVIISADKRIEPIMAYSEVGSYKKSGILPRGLANWLIKNHSNISRIKNNPSIKRPENVKNLWKELLSDLNKNTSGNSIGRNVPVAPPCQNQYYNTTIGPLLATQWGQACDYNDYCPSGNICNSHTWTGCVATSMSQIMRYWQFPSNYNWSSMPNNSGNLEVARLMHDAGLSVGMTYSDNGSGAFTSNVPNALKNNFGYSSVSFGDYDSNAMINEMNAHRPVLLSGFTDHNEQDFLWWKISDNPAGEGHAWVCDGYQYNSYSYCDCSCGGSYSMLHMNWGWNEIGTSNNYNGWYNEGNWTVARTDQTLNFQYFKQMVYNIHP